MSKNIIALDELKTGKKAIPPDELEQMKKDLVLIAEKLERLAAFTKLHFKRNSNPNAD